MKIEIKKVSDLSSGERSLINKHRVKEFDGEAAMDFNKKENLDSEFFLIKSNQKLVAFGMLTPVIITYQNKKYPILGFGSGIAIEKKKGYGRLLMALRIAYTKSQGKTGIGFCGRHNLKRFEAYGMKTKKNYIKRFIYVNPTTWEESKDPDGDMIYIEGPDKLVSKMLKTKSIAYCNKPHW
ncbi:MAG: hypothetical protein NUV97_03790 [archaeon]|nr:hypothetical protein [archaeon]MCR4323860.1 hypothetical protein [Nanoarchaeota archaeon]